MTTLIYAGISRKAMKAAVTGHADWQTMRENNNLKSSDMKLSDLHACAAALGINRNDIVNMTGAETQDQTDNGDDTQDETQADTVNADANPFGIFDTPKTQDQLDVAADDTPESVADTEPQSDRPRLPMIATDPEQVIDQASIDRDYQTLRDANPLDVVDIYQDLSRRANTAQIVDRVEIRETVVYVEKAAQTVNAAASGIAGAHAGLSTLGDVFGLSGGAEALEVSTWSCSNPEPVDLNYQFRPDHVAIAVAAMEASPLAMPVFLAGPKSTGKTSFAQQIAARTGRNYVEIAINENIESADLLGQEYPTAGGGMAWRDGVLLAGMQVPGSLIMLDEISNSRPRTIACLQPLLDHRRQVTLEDGRVIKAAHGVVFFTADNTFGFGDTTGNYAGAMPLNAALRSRFMVTLGFEYLDEAAERALIASRSGCNADVAEALSAFAKLTQHGAENDNLSEAIAYRQLIAWATLATAGIPSEHAFNSAVTLGTPPGDQEYMAQLIAGQFDHTNLDRAVAGKAPRIPAQVNPNAPEMDEVETED